MLKYLKIFATSIIPWIICPLLVFYFQEYYKRPTIEIKSSINRKNEFSIYINNDSEESLEDVRILVEFSSTINTQSIQGSYLDTGVSLPLSKKSERSCLFEGSKENPINLRSHEALQIKGKFKSAIAQKEPHVIVRGGKKGYADSVLQKRDKLIANGISLAAIAFFLGIVLYYWVYKRMVDVILVAIDRRKVKEYRLEYSLRDIELERLLLEKCYAGNRYAIRILDRRYMPIVENKFRKIGLKKRSIEKFWRIIKLTLYEIVEKGVPLNRRLADVIRDMTEDIIYDLKEQLYQSLLEESIAENLDYEKDGEA